MSNTASSVQAAELSLGIARRGTGRAPAIESRDSNVTWAVGLFLLVALAMRVLLIWLGPWSDASRAVAPASDAYLQVAAAFDAGDFLATADGAVMGDVERMTPGYPSLLAIAQSLSAPVQLVLGLQAAMWCGVVYLTYLVGVVLLGNVRSGLVAAAVVAVHPAGWVATATLLPESLGVALLVLAVWLAAERRRRDLSGAALGGVATGLAMLTLPLSCALGPALAVWIAVSDRRWHGLAAAAVFGAASVVPTAAWSLRNASSGSSIGIVEMVLPAPASQLVDASRAWAAATGHGIGSASERVGLVASMDMLDGSAINLIGGGVSLAAAPALAWGALTALLALGAIVGGAALFARGRLPAVALLVLLLGAAWAAPGGAEVWRLQSLALTPAALLLAGLCAEGELVLRRRRKAESAGTDSPAIVSDGRPL